MNLSTGQVLAVRATAIAAWLLLVPSLVALAGGGMVARFLGLVAAGAVAAPAVLLLLEAIRHATRDTDE